MITSYIHILKEEKYRDLVLDSLSGYDNLVYSSDLRDFLDKFIKEHIHKFSEFEDRYLYKDGSEIITIIMPIIRKIYLRIFISPPFSVDNSNLELFRLMFNFDELCDYLIEIINENETALEKFKYLDKGSEMITLIVDNYIAYLVKKVTNTENIKLEIRNLKIKNIL